MYSSPVARRWSASRTVVRCLSVLALVLGLAAVTASARSLPTRRASSTPAPHTRAAIDWATLTAPGLQNLTLLEVSSASALDLASLPLGACAGWLPSQLSVLESQCSGFQVTCIANITASAIVGIGADCANTLLDQVTQGFTAAQLVNLQPTAWAALTASSIGGLTQAACAGVTAAGIAAISSNTGQFPNTVDACQGLTPQCVAGAPSTAFSALTASCGQQFQIPIFSVLSSSQLGNMSADVFSVLNADQLGALGSNCAGMQPEQIDQIVDDGPAAGQGQPQMCNALQASCVVALTPVAIGAIGSNCAGDLVASAFASFTGPQLAAFNINGTGGLIRSEITALASTICDSFSGDQLAVLGTLNAPYDACGGFTSACLSSISASKFAFLMPTCFGFLEPPAFATLSPEQIGAVNLPAIRGMSAPQLAQLPSGSCAGFTPDQVELLGSISPYDTCSALTLPCLQALTPTAFGQLTSTCYSFIPSTYISSFSFSQVTSISPSAVAGVTADQLIAWTATYNAELIGPAGGVWSSPLHTSDLSWMTLLGFKGAVASGGLLPNFTLTELANVVELSGMTSLQLAYCVEGCMEILLASGAAGAQPNILFLPLSTYRGLRADQIASIPPAIFAQFGRSVLSLLLPDSVNAITPDQIETVSTQAFTALNLGQLSIDNGAIQALNQALIAAVSESQWINQFQCVQYNNMTASQRGWMSAASVFARVCSGGSSVAPCSGSSGYSQTVFLGSVLGGIGGTFLLCVAGYFACLRPRYLHEVSQTSVGHSDRLYHGGRLEAEGATHDYSGSASLSRSMSGSSKTRRMGLPIKDATSLRQPLVSQSHIAPGSSPILVKAGTSATPPYTQQDVAQAHLDDSDDDVIGSRF